MKLNLAEPGVMSMICLYSDIQPNQYIICINCNITSLLFVVTNKLFAITILLPTSTNKLFV